MEVIRILDLRLFDRDRQRFRDLVYKNSSRAPEAPETPDGRGGFSVIGLECACNGVDGDCVCGHIAQFYSGVAPQPCAYWRFDTNEFNPPSPNPQNLTAPVMLEVPSDTGDDCHRNVHHVSDSRLEKKFKKLQANMALRLCVDGHSQTFSVEQATALYNQHFPDPE